MAEAHEQRGDAVDAGFQGIDPGQQFVELGGDAGLFGKRRDSNFNHLEVGRLQVVDVYPSR